MIGSPVMLKRACLPLDSLTAVNQAIQMVRYIASRSYHQSYMKVIEAALRGVLVTKVSNRSCVSHLVRSILEYLKGLHCVEWLKLQSLIQQLQFLDSDIYQMTLKFIKTHSKPPELAHDWIEEAN